jgi:opacity protein-like surface antigen
LTIHRKVHRRLPSDTIEKNDEGFLSIFLIEKENRMKKFKMQNIFGLLAILIMVLFMSMPGRVSAQEEAQGDKWQFGAELYLWMASIGGTATSGEDIDIDFDTIIDNLDMAFMGGLQAKKGKWSFMLDAIYLNASGDKSGTITVPIGPGVELPVNASLELKNWIVFPYVGYNLVTTEKAQLDILAGARYLWMEVDLGLSLVEPPVSQTVSDSGSVWDAIVGIRGKLILSENWYLPYHFDVGTGQTDFTWQAFAGIGYSFSSIDVVAAYRYLEWDFDDNDVFDDMNVNGPLLGVRFRW